MPTPTSQPEPAAQQSDPVTELTGIPEQALPSDPGEQALPRDAAHWAGKVSRLQADPGSPAKDDNVTGRRLMGPVQGFGKMWQKTYTADVGADVTPKQAIATWKADFGMFWPKGNVFHGALTGIAPGDVALLDLSMPGGVRLSTGVMVLYADDESFTLMTPPGAHVRRLDHQLRIRAGRLDGVAVAGAHAGQRPALRAGPDVRGSPQGEPFLARHPPRACRAPRRLECRAHHHRGLRGQAPAVAQSRQHLAQRRHPHHAAHAARPGPDGHPAPRSDARHNRKMTGR